MTTTRMKKNDDDDDDYLYEYQQYLLVLIEKIRIRLWMLWFRIEQWMQDNIFLFGFFCAFSEYQEYMTLYQTSEWWIFKLAMIRPFYNMIVTLRKYWKGGSSSS